MKFFEQRSSINFRRSGRNFLGIFGRRGTRLFLALGKICNGADKYPHVFGGRNSDFVVNAAEKFFHIDWNFKASSATLARRDNLRDNRNHVYAVHIFSRNINRRSGGDNCNLLRLPGDGRHVGIILPQKISEAWRNYRGCFGNERRLFARDGRQFYKITRAARMCNLVFAKRRGFCFQRDFPETFICKKN